DGQEEGYAVAPLFGIGHKFTERILQLSLVSNASVIWVLCTDTYTCDLVSLKQEEEPEKEEQVEQVEQAEATGVATSANNAVLIAICVFLALLSSALSLYICWAKHRGEKTCQKQQLESMLSSFPVFFRTIIPDSDIPSGESVTCKKKLLPRPQDKLRTQQREQSLRRDTSDVPGGFYIAI
ncbi:uncharacterized protein LOC119568782, partial [Penaeus monodon]|uniref:uncharacterized protein LOC119568782 n=1 Tax=Penaeus monodon TaxID=6687 RepID=UPI0018A6FF0E